MALKRFYPTPSTTKCYVNGIELDDMFRVDFKRNINHQPIYGYDDQQFGFVARGKELVSGQIIINFRYPGYLTAIIKNSKKYQDILARSTEIFYEDNNRISTSVENDRLAGIMESMNDSDKAKYVTQLMLGVSNATPGAREQQIIDFKNQLKDLYIADAKKSGQDQAILELNSFNGLQSPLDFDTSTNKFDLKVKYGFQDKDGMYERVFKECVIVGESSTVSAAAGAGNDMSSSAQGILEVYPFFCKTIKVVR
jgi:hypothetical protein